MKAALAFALSCLACATAPAKPSDLNSIARADYAEARTRALHALGPVLLVGPSQITLIAADGSRSTTELAPPAYHELKTVAHLALGVHSLFYAQTPPQSSLAQLRAAALALPLPEPRARQEQIVQLSVQALDGALPLAQYERKVAPLLLDNALDAARLEIADLDKAVALTRQKLGADFARLHVVVVGAHMAREGEIAQQYFEELFDEREGGRIVFAEGLWDEPAELQLLATHVLDSSIGAGFFDDPQRMHRDLLSDAAAQVLRERHHR